MEYKFHEVSKLFPLLEGKAFDELVQDIKNNGLLEPIWLHEEKIVDGRNRYRACKVAGVEPRFRVWNGKGSLVSFVVSLNLRRRHLTQSQVACVGVDALPFYEKEAKERMKHEGDTYGKIAIGDLGAARDFAANDFHVAARYISDAKMVKQASPEEFEEVKAGNKKLSQVTRQLKKEKQLQHLHELQPIEGKFNVIVVDPPWKPTVEYNAEGWRGEGDYPTMDYEELKKIKLPTEENCVLWLWSIDYFLNEALQLIKEWGFERKSTLVWVKDKMGLGHWLRNQHEYCFLAVRGKPVFHGENIPSVLHAARRKHSEKPDEFYALVEKASPYKAKLDYFSRKKRGGWQCYGDEVK